VQSDNQQATRIFRKRIYKIVSKINFHFNF